MIFCAHRCYQESLSRSVPGTSSPCILMFFILSFSPLDSSENKSGKEDQKIRLDSKPHDSRRFISTDLCITMFIIPAGNAPTLPSTNYIRISKVTCVQNSPS